MAMTTRTVGLIVAGAIVLVALAIVAALDAVVRVRPLEVAVVEPFSGEPYLQGPGKLYKRPFLDRVTLINPSNEHSTTIDVAAPLADGSACVVRAKLVFRVADPMQFVAWRHEQSLPANSEVKKIFAKALRDTMSSIDPKDAREGAIERWVYAFQKDNAGRTLQDGAAFIRLRTDDVGCSEIASYDDAIRMDTEPSSD